MKFIVTDAIRWMDMEVDISSFQNPEELVREVVKQRATLREKRESLTSSALFAWARGIAKSGFYA